MKSDILNKLKTVCPDSLKDEPMKFHTTFKIGGPADYFCEPSNIQELSEILRIVKEENIPYIITGNGSNMLVSDKGIEGVVISISHKFCDIQTMGERICAGAGVLLSVLSKKALSYGLTGLEFASGIPGTLGGAVYMNAGAYGGEMKDIVKSVLFMDSDGITGNVQGDDLCFGYRRSCFTDKDLIILSCEMELKKGVREEIAAKMAELSKRRSSKQPLDMPSAGSVFKRPQGYFAGTLIEQAGLKGVSIGGAEVSKKHAGFIVNKKDATAADVMALIEYIINTVEKKYSVRLEPEIKLIGR